LFTGSGADQSVTPLMAADLDASAAKVTIEPDGLALYEVIFSYLFKTCQQEGIDHLQQ